MAGNSHSNSYSHRFSLTKVLAELRHDFDSGDSDMHLWEKGEEFEMENESSILSPVYSNCSHIRGSPDSSAFELQISDSEIDYGTQQPYRSVSSDGN